MKKDIIRNVYGIEDYDGCTYYCDECGCEIDGEVYIIGKGRARRELCEFCAWETLDSQEQQGEKDAEQGE